MARFKVWSRSEAEDVVDALMVGEDFSTVYRDSALYVSAVLVDRCIPFSCEVSAGYLSDRMWVFHVSGVAVESANE